MTVAALIDATQSTRELAGDAFAMKGALMSGHVPHKRPRKPISQVDDGDVAGRTARDSSAGHSGDQVHPIPGLVFDAAESAPRAQRWELSTPTIRRGMALRPSDRMVNSKASTGSSASSSLAALTPDLATGYPAEGTGGTLPGHAGPMPMPMPMSGSSWPQFPYSAWTGAAATGSPVPRPMAVPAVFPFPAPPTADSPAPPMADNALVARHPRGGNPLARLAAAGLNATSGVRANASRAGLNAMENVKIAASKVVTRIRPTGPRPAAAQISSDAQPPNVSGARAAVHGAMERRPGRIHLDLEVNG